MRKTNFKRKWIGLLLAVCLVVGVPTVAVLAGEGSSMDEIKSVEEQSALQEFCTHKNPVGDCNICLAQTLIDALPDADAITADNADEVTAQLNAISDLWTELNDEETDSLDITRYAAAVDAMENLNGTGEAGVPNLTAALTLSVNYPSIIKCGEPTTFTLNVTGGSGNYKYRLANLMINDGSGLVQVYDVSYPSKPNLGEYSEDNEIEFTFYASGTYYIGFSAIDMDTYATVSTRLYDYTLDIQDAVYPSVEKIVETVAAECETKCTTDFEKALWLHDWLLDNADYDYSFRYSSAEGVLARGVGTCESYHRAYVMLLNKVGIQTGRITGNGHVWTAVKMDGEWYQIDSTWDDGGESNKGTYYEHMYFGLNDYIMGLVHSDHTGAVSGYESTDLENNYFIKTGQITQWSDTFVDDIKKNIADGKTEFELSVTSSMPPNYKNVIYNLVAYQLSQQTWDNAKITVTYADDVLSCKLSVSSTSVKLNQTSANVKLGSTFDLIATVDPSNSSDFVTWKSGNSKIATVSSGGQVKAIGLGRTTITATVGGVSATCTVDVAPNISLTTLGASIRISDPYGIRYGIQLKKDDAYKSTDIVEYGTLIIASGTLGNNELTIDTQSVRRIPAEVIYQEDSSQITYTGVLINIPTSFF